MAWEDWSNYEIGYVSGFIDGEGSICISKGRDGYYRLTINLYNTHYETMQFLENLIGNTVVKRTIDKRRDRLHNKDNYVITIRKDVDSYNFLIFIKDYLVTKKRQAYNALNFLEVKFNRESLKFSDEDKEKMEQLYTAQRALNRGD